METNGFSHTRSRFLDPLSRKPRAERRLSPELLGNPIMLLAPSQEPATSFSEQAAGQKGPVLERDQTF